MKLVIGNSTIGYDSAEIVKKGHKYVIAGEIFGRKTWVKKALSNVNKGIFEFITSAGDSLPVYIQ